MQTHATMYCKYYQLQVLYTCVAYSLHFMYSSHGNTQVPWLISEVLDGVLEHLFNWTTWACIQIQVIFF